MYIDHYTVVVVYEHGKATNLICNNETIIMFWGKFQVNEPFTTREAEIETL